MNCSDNLNSCDSSHNHEQTSQAMHENHLHRRDMLGVTGTAVAAAVLGMGRSAAAGPAAEIEELKVISHQPELFHGWPTIARRKNGQLLVVCSGGRESHVCPFGRVELMRSDDGGETWGWPCVVMDCEIDDRDAGVLETAQGTLLITSFTSLAYERRLSPDRPRWQAAHNRLSAEQRQKLVEIREWMIRSTDEGLTWSGRFDSVVNSPHGPTQLADGRLLYAGKEMRTGSNGRIGVSESTDDGATWNWLAEIPTREGDTHRDYHELHAVETADGRIIAQIRNHNDQHRHETLQCESADGGRTWTAPASIGVWGYPSHLLRLRDDRLLMTYGHRRSPRGNQARISEDHGRTWSEPMILSGDGTGDLGYPSTVELDDGTLVSVWYEVIAGSRNAVLRQARWRLKA